MNNTLICDPDPATDRANLAVALLVFLCSAVVYFLTVAPTFSFWDCGEFVACAYTLGIPHPPGSPLFIIIGRLFSVLPFADDISLRINTFSVLTSAGAVGFGYLIIQRLSSQIINVSVGMFNRVSTYICGAVGALTMAFGRTFWNNAVEAEVYGLAMLLFFAALWFGILAFDTESSSRRVRMLILSVYLAILGSGVHLIVFLAVPVVGSLFIFRKLSNTKAGFLATIFVVVIAFLAFVTSSRESEIPYNLPLGILLIIFIIHVASLAKVTRGLLVTGLALLLANYDSLIQIYENITRSSAPSSLGFAPVGWIGLGALTLWGIWSAYSLRYSGRKSLRSSSRKGIDNSQRDSQKISAAYAAFAVMAVSATLWLNGYDDFKIFLGAGALVVVALFRSQINWRFVIALLSISSIAFGFWPFIFLSSLGIVCLCA
ncbi:MAG: DUF2723 domain-containing protein, partial [candidate division Zixibacteria bacterium]|nr:DUF2723 domain-containing protein [candidate division Zixibacteria bacterium]